MERRRRAIWAVLVSLGAAVLFWTYTRLGQTYTATFRVPLKIQLPSEIALATPPPSELTVHVHGTGWQLLFMELWGRPSEVLLPLHGARQDSHISIGKQQLIQLLNLPGTVTLLSISPDSLILRAEQAHTRVFPITSRLRLELPQGFVLTKLLLEPDSVTVRGTMHALEGVSSVVTEDFSLTPRGEEFSVELPLTVNATLPVELMPGRVRVHGWIQPEAEVVLDGVPVEIFPALAFPRHTVVPQYVRIWVRGPLNQLAELSPQDVRVVLPYTELVRDTIGALLPQAFAPEGVEIFRIDPPRIFHWQQQ
ncbi:MAG: CdaR family protein [Candidatus Kapabacteria bacterium]|nr:CdaR family protein [Candidatus Kapabacteria bacterium]MDW8225701.1 CdaR family protein [Bacteroidota bacterium]